MDTSSITPNRRVQKFLDHADSHGWTVGHPDPEAHTFLVYPHHDYTEGFVVHDLPNNAARVLRADTYKPVSQKEATAIIEAHHHDKVDLLDQVEVSSTILADDSDEVVILTEFAIPEDLPEKDKSEWSQGALLAATTIANLLEQSTAVAVGLGGIIDPEHYQTAIVSPHAAAHAYLHLANQVRDPRTLSIVFKDFEGEPSKALTSGARAVCVGLVNVWTGFADGLFALDANLGAPLSEFMQGFHDHAASIRESAAEKFGDGVTLTDDDFEGLLK